MGPAVMHGVHAGLEIFFIDAGGGGSATGPSVFFTFGSELERDDVASVIADQPSIGASLPGGRAAASACGSILEVHMPLLLLRPLCFRSK